MKKLKMVLVLVLSIFFASLAQAKGDEIIIEYINSDCLVLKPQPLTAKSYENSNNIFLKITGREENTFYKSVKFGNWFKKSNGVINIISLNDRFKRDLRENLAYEVIDTLYCNKKIIDDLDTGNLGFYEESFLRLSEGSQGFYLDCLKEAYLGKDVVITGTMKLDYLDNYSTKAKITKNYLILSYNAESKEFFEKTVGPVIETKTIISPLILFILFFLLAIFSTIKEGIKYRLINAFLISLVTLIFVSSYQGCFEDWAITLSLPVGALLSCIVFCTMMLFSEKQRTDSPEDKTITKPATAIAIVFFLELIIIGLPFGFVIIGSLIILSPAVIKRYFFKK